MSLVVRQRLWSLFEALYSQQLNSESIRTATPEWIKTPLLPHQQAALAAAYSLEKAKTQGMNVEPIPGEPDGGTFFTSHGILGDHVGSGKSLTALSLVKMPHPPAQYTEFSLRNGSLGNGRDVGLLRQRSQLRLHATGRTLREVSTSLFIIPHALVSQWETYVSRDTTLRAKFIKKRSDATADDFIDTLETYDIIFVSATMYNLWRATHPIHTLMWRRIFIDEADSISLSTLHDELHGLFYWFISASWMNLLFSTGAYFNLVTHFSPLPSTPAPIIEKVYRLLAGTPYLSIPGVRHVNIVRRMAGCGSASGYNINGATFHSARLIIQSDEEFIKASFTPPVIRHTNVLCATPANIRVLDSMISPDMMERLNAGDLRSALDMIGMRAQSEEEISNAVTASLEHDLEQARHTHEYKKGLDYSSDAAKQKALEACEQKIASLESRIQTIKDRVKSSASSNCPICYCEVQNTAVTPCCQQIFCFLCLCESLKRASSCPLCRERIRDIKSIKVVRNSEEDEDDNEKNKIVDKPPNKKEAFLRFLNTRKDAKILMFSNYDASFGLMEQEMREAGLTFATLSGTQTRINKLLRDFKDGKYNVLFLNAKNMGAGLNIECASHVVLYHKMSAELEDQIVGRAVRIGRTSDLEVVHLLHENELGNTITHV